MTSWRDEDGLCPLCGRPLGRKTEAHHLIPRSLGGRETVALHPICHRKIHTTLTEREIAESHATLPALRAHPDIARFIRWIRNKPPDFYKRTERRSRP
ncbi:MAG: HNH endonuclease [Sphingomonadales bacterium]|nr:HNH endonuclease [Sphingomonadales bacterium]